MHARYIGALSSGFKRHGRVCASVNCPGELENRQNQRGDQSGTTLTNLDHIKCKNCGGIGHFPSKCPSRKMSSASKDGDQATGTHFSFSQFTMATSDSTPGVSKEWILLDSCSSVNVFCNSSLLSNIRVVDSTMTVYCNAGSRRTNCVGDLAGYGTVWYHPGFITNILSLTRVNHRFQVTYAGDEDCFHVAGSNGFIHRFAQSGTGVYCVDTADPSNFAGTPAESSGFTFVETVADNLQKYSADDVARAKRARSFQIRIGRPSVDTLFRVV